MISTTLQYNYRRIGIFLFLYMLVWIIAPTLLAQSVALDVAEGVTWGRELQLGYYKHPPVSSWFLYAFYNVLGDYGIYLLSQLCVVISLYFIYLLGKKCFSQDSSRALMGSLSLFLVLYYSYPTVEFNHNIAQFPIWSGLLYLFYLSLTRGYWRDWFGFAILGGIGMMVKYHVVFLLFAMALFLVLPSQRHWLKTIKPWIVAIIMLAVFSPHLWWLIQNNWLPFTYASQRAHANSFLAGHFSWVGFLLAQLVVHIPLISTLILIKYKYNLQLQLPKFQLFNSIILATNKGKAYQSTQPTQQKSTFAKQDNFGKQYIWCMAWLPVLILCCFSLFLGFGLRDMWGMPMWSLSGLLLISVLPSQSWQHIQATLIRSIMVWLTIVSIVMIILVGFSDEIRGKPSRMHYPQNKLAQATLQTWQSVSKCPIDSLSGDRWYISLIAMRLPEFPSLMIAGSPTYSPWMTSERLDKYGTLVIQEPKNEDDLPLLSSLKNNPDIKVYQGKWTIPWQRIKNHEPLQLAWTAYVPVQCEK